MYDIWLALTDVFDRHLETILLMATMLAASMMAWMAISAVATYNRVQGRATSAEDTEQSAAKSGQKARGKLASVANMLSGDNSAADVQSAKVLRQKLIQAGFYARHAVPVFFLVRLCFLILFGSGALFAVLAFSDQPLAPTAMITMIAAIFGYVMPSFALDNRIAKLRLEHRLGFPDFMDLMVVCSQAGLSMEASLSRIADELALAFPSLARNLELTTAEIRNGKALSRAIESLAGRLGIEEASSFSTLLQQSEELGSSLTRSLRAFSDDMRNKRLMKAEEKAYSLPAKLVVPLTLFVFPVLLIVLMLPVAISISGSKL